MKRLVLIALLCGGSATALGQNAGGNATNGAPAADQDQQQLQEIVVTGTLIRGQEAPIGQELTTVGNPEITATGATNFADVMATVPMLNSFNIAPQG
jgi:hypothetical protein